ncbi:MAG TPA: hypothetical protein VLJ21_03050 [Candidatus Binatia bacterium]|nr:hypothetical protein [Candidatus Binatia bacterium]
MFQTPFENELDKVLYKEAFMLGKPLYRKDLLLGVQADEPFKHPHLDKMGKAMSDMAADLKGIEAELVRHLSDVFHAGSFENQELLKDDGWSIVRLRDAKLLDVRVAYGIEVNEPRSVVDRAESEELERLIEKHVAQGTFFEHLNIYCAQGKRNWLFGFIANSDGCFDDQEVRHPYDGAALAARVRRALVKVVSGEME